MPKKYDIDTKTNALFHLEMHKNINVVHQLTGIPKRTLRYWRAERRADLAGKNVSSATNPVTNTRDGNIKWNSGNKTTNHGNNPSQSGNKMTERGNNSAINTDTVGSRHVSTANNPNDKTDSYPLEEDTDYYADFKQLRENLMGHAQELASNLNTADEDISLRTLALARILDRILQLDQIIPQYNPEKVVRFKFVHNGNVYDRLPWQLSDEDINP